MGTNGYAIWPQRPAKSDKQRMREFLVKKCGGKKR
jgi:hypothetical protein